MSLNHKGDPGVVTFSDFKRFALEKCGKAASGCSASSTASVDAALDESEIAHGFYDGSDAGNEDFFEDGRKVRWLAWVQRLFACLTNAPHPPLLSLQNNPLDLSSSIMSNIARTHNAVPPPLSFLEEKFQHLCGRARERYAMDVWGGMDEMAEVGLIGEEVFGGDREKGPTKAAYDRFSPNHNRLFRPSSSGRG